MRTFSLLCILTIFFPCFVFTLDSGCGVVRLDEGSMPGFSGLHLGKPVQFEEEIAEFECFPILYGNRILAWIHEAHVCDGTVIVRRCKEDMSEHHDIALTKGSIKGFIEDFYEEMRWNSKTSKARFLPLELPLFTYFSNASFCEKYVAYWGDKKEGDGKSYAIIYDLKSRRVVHKKSFWVEPGETDYAGFLPQPIWDLENRKVTFVAPDNVKAEFKKMDLPIP